MGFKSYVTLLDDSSNEIKLEMNCEYKYIRGSFHLQTQNWSVIGGSQLHLRN